MQSSLLFALLQLTLTAQASENWEHSVNEEGKSVQSLKIEAPSMTEEDQYGYNMPEQYRCDSCKAVVYHLNDALKKRQPKTRRLHEWEYHELFDETCAKGLSGYGVALVNGKNVLSGPGLEKRDDLAPGMGAIQMGGETWEKRLGEICRKFVYEKVGEDEVYDHFRAKGELSTDLCFQETRDCRLGPEAPVSPSKDKKSSKQAKAKAKSQQKPEMDMSTFISKLAKKHGIATAEYTRKRTFAEWEQLFVLASKRISDGNTKESDKVVEV